MMEQYKKLVKALDGDRWHHCRVIAGLCEENDQPHMAWAWRWIADNRRWPYKHKTHTLYGWYMVPSEPDKLKMWMHRRESAATNLLIGGGREFTGTSRRRRCGVKYMANKYHSTIGEAMDALAIGLTLAKIAGEFEEKIQ